MVTNDECIKIFKKGGVAVLKTDTLYGILGQALNQKTVERIYKIKGRNKSKPFIILISNISDLRKFGVQVDTQTKTILKNYWPGKTSVILPLSDKRQAIGDKLKYLHRGKKSLAFRMPAKKSLINILEKSGPLVAPSANPEGLPPAENISEAKKYFGEEVDFYLSGGKADSKPSKLIAIKNGKIIVLRK